MSNFTFRHAIGFLWGLCLCNLPAHGDNVVPANRVASILISESFINQQLALHLKAQVLKSLRIVVDPEHDRILFRGLLQVPIEELRAINLDPKLGAFRFQATVKLEVTKKGHLILNFPLSETFLYPDGSPNPTREKIIVPVQLISVALASARGYLAALSGDFSGFDRRTLKLAALEKALDHSIAHEKNTDALEEMKNQRESIRIQLAAIPIERKQLETTSKQVDKILGLTGEKELNLNQDLGARKNALILKVKLSQLAPYLDGVELGGIRLIHDKKDGSGENYLAIDVNSVLEGPTVTAASTPAARTAMKIPPAFIIRLNQSLFESEAVLAAEQKAAMAKIQNFNLLLKDDGLHVSGKYKLLFFSVPFDTVVDFVTTQPDVFEVRVRDIKVAGIDFEFLSKIVLESVEKRLYKAMKGTCKFQYLGEEKDHSRALQVSLNTEKMLPAFSDLHLVSVDVRDREFLLKIGQRENAVGSTNRGGPVTDYANH